MAWNFWSPRSTLVDQSPISILPQTLELPCKVKPHAEVWAVSMTEHQAMLDEFFEDPQLTILVTGNLDPTEAYPGCVSVEFGSHWSLNNGGAGDIIMRLTRQNQTSSSAVGRFLLELVVSTDINYLKPVTN